MRLKVRQKQVCIIHIASQVRLKELFGLAGQTAIEFKGNLLTKTFCGKVNMMNRHSRNMTGYVMQEEGYRW